VNISITNIISYKCC